MFKTGGRPSLSYLSVYPLCLRCLLEQLHDLLVASLSDIGQSGLATVFDVILLCSRGKEELFTISMSWQLLPLLINSISTCPDSLTVLHLYFSFSRKASQINASPSPSAEP